MKKITQDIREAMSKILQACGAPEPVYRAILKAPITVAPEKCFEDLAAEQRQARIKAYARGASDVCPSCGQKNCTKLAAAMKDADNRKRAQKVRDEIFREADAFIFPPDWETNPNADVKPVFFTPEQKAAREDAQLRARADAVLRRIRVDEMWEGN